MRDLWSSDSAGDWSAALRGYESVVEKQKPAKLPELDRWYRTELPGAISGRKPRHVVHEELVRVTEWKMARGVWRARNLALVRGNDPAAVIEVSTVALGSVPDPTAPISSLSELAGVGPATASAIASASAPEVYPFFDELVAAQVPGLGPVAFTLTYYRRYAEAIRTRGEQLGPEWTPAVVERALWSNSGGKAAV